MRVMVVGATGFVGAALLRHLESEGVTVIGVTRQNYEQHRGARVDVLLDAAGNSRKYLADSEPLADFDLTVRGTMERLVDFKAGLYVLISSVDVYADTSTPTTTREQAPIDVERVSRYGLSKFLAESCVRRHAARWRIFRLGGMVGPGLRKNPIFDLVNRRRLWVHPDSRYQYLGVDDMARIVWSLTASGRAEGILNVCGDGLISPREAAVASGVALEGPEDATPQCYEVSIERLKEATTVPSSRDAVLRFVREHVAGA